MSQVYPANAILESWNHLEQRSAAEAILPCNGSRAWASGVVSECPFAIPEQLFAAADSVWLALPKMDWQQAFDSHPRIGEAKAKSATEHSAAWSREEQSAAKLNAETQIQLAAANTLYEAKFGRIFLICASGKSAPEILASLKERLAHDEATELRIAVEEQRKITQLRLRKWLQLPAAACGEV